MQAFTNILTKVMLEPKNIKNFSGQKAQEKTHPLPNDVFKSSPNLEIREILAC